MRSGSILLLNFSSMLPVNRVKLLISRVKQQDPRVKQHPCFPENVTTLIDRVEIHP